ncbi:hypothetical protein PENTCL1PPCAC_11047, partial [Pristionchus entomophagus]
ATQLCLSVAPHTPLVMMANYFSDSSLSEWSHTSQSALLGEDPVLFYSPSYEQELMDKFLPESPSRSEFLASDDGFPSSVIASTGSSHDDFLLDEIENEATPIDEPVSYEEEVYEEDVQEYMDVPYESESSVSPTPSPPPRKTTRRQQFIAPASPMRVHSSSEIKKRGRPVGSKSNTKMAQYSKQYREAKKNEAATLNAEILDLSNDNSRLQKENDRLHAEVDALRKADAVNDAIATLLITVRSNPGRFRLCIDIHGKPYLEVV